MSRDPCRTSTRPAAVAHPCSGFQAPTTLDCRFPVEWPPQCRRGRLGVKEAPKQHPGDVLVVLREEIPEARSTIRTKRIAFRLD